MSSEIEVWHRLRDSPAIFRAIADWKGNELQLQAQLRRDYPDEVVRGALTLADLRKKGAAKFSRADRMWFDRVGLEQSTSEAVARHKARRFAGCERVWDYCSGIGGDAIAIAGSSAVIAVDRDPLACLASRWNAEVYGVDARCTVICADVETIVEPGRFVHVDPDRRSASRPGRGRSVRIEEGSPGLAFLATLIHEARGGAVKTSPAANFGGKFPAAEVELISLDGECKEATIWFGELAGAERWRATALPSGETIAGDPLSAVAPLGPLGRYLFDPDPALVRAGLVDLFASKSGLCRLDDEEEYLTGDEPPASAFVRTFQVVAELPNQERAIRDHFRGSGIGQVEIKCRRIPIDVEGVRRKLPLEGKDAAVLVFARVEGRARAVICHRVHV